MQKQTVINSLFCSFVCSFIHSFFQEVLGMDLLGKYNYTLRSCLKMKGIAG